VVAPIKVLIEGDAKNLNNVLKGAGNDVGLFGKAVGKVAPKLLGAVAPAIPAIKAVAKATKEVTSAAKDAAAEEAIFADAMAATGAAQGDWVAQTDEAIKAGQKLAFSDTETRKAIVALSTATGDTAQALDLLTVAQDVARLSGSSLEQASDAVAKAAAGQDAALKRMLPGLAETASAEETIAAAADLAAGSADNFSKSSEAGAIKAQIAFDELKETVGGPLLEAFNALREALKPVIELLMKVIQIILPPMLKYFTKLFEILGKVATALGKVADAVGRLIEKVKALLEPLDKAISKLREIDLNPFGEKIRGASAVVSGAMSVGALAAPTTQGAAGSGGVVINIYGDPSVIEARVTKALRDYARRNGVTAVFTPDRS
jgi:hypothetical protein